MSERITTDQISPRVRRLRRWQVMLAVCGMCAFMVSLIGGVLKSRGIVWLGLGGFAFSLVSLFAVGIASWAMTAKPKPD